MSLVADREPATTYDKALWRLVYLLAAADDSPSAVAPPSIGMVLLADIYWLKPERVRADVCRYFRRIG